MCPIEIGASNAGSVSYAHINEGFQENARPYAVLICASGLCFFGKCKLFQLCLLVKLLNSMFQCGFALLEMSLRSKIFYGGRRIVEKNRLICKLLF